MISSALLLSASLLASPIIIEDVQASREAGHLRVEVVGDGGIDPDGARTKIENGVLLISLGGTRVRADNRSWELADGAGEIRAHRHKNEIELVVPLAGNGCDGPVELQGTDSGITALVGCDGAVAARVPAAKVRKQAASQVEAEGKVEQLKALIELPAAAEPALAAPKAEAKVAETKAKPEAKLEAKTETKPEAKGEAKLEAKLEAKTETKPEAKAETKSAPKPEATAEPTPALRVDGKAALVTDVLPAEPAVPAAARAGATGGGLQSMGLPALLLALLAAGAYWFARRRRVVSVRHIQILETASLGPKRSLVVARVGDETLILGTSEAGITLLRGTANVAGATVTAAQANMVSLGELQTSTVTRAEADAAAEAQAAADAAAAAFEISQPLEEALADIPEPDSLYPTTRGGFRAIEGGLAGLFNGRRSDKVQTDIESEDDLHERFEARLQARLASRRPEAKREDSFEDLLEDSVEDQELRRKLAAGMSTRVR